MSLITQRHGMLWAANNGGSPTPTPPTPGTYQLKGRTVRSPSGTFPITYTYKVEHLGELTTNAIRYLRGNSSAVITPLFNYDQRGVATATSGNRWAAAICDISGQGFYLVVDYPNRNALTANTPITIDFSSPLSWSNLTWNDIVNDTHGLGGYCLKLGAYDNDAATKEFLSDDSSGTGPWRSADTGVDGYVNVSEYTVA